MSASPVVSVVTATYNMAQFLGAAIHTVLAQTWSDFQYIIIDDGSSDGTREVVAPFLSDPRVEYHYQENQGQTLAKNNGARRARGEFICFLDGDNLWLPHKLQMQLDLFRTLPESVGIVYTEQEFIDESGRVTGRPTLTPYSGRISQQLLFENFVTFNSAMIRHDCLRKHGYFDESLQRSIDYELWLRLSAHYEFRYVPDVTTQYRKWSGQMSQDLDRRFAVAMQIMETFIARHPQLLDPAVIRRARNHAYTARGRYKASKARRVEATRLFCRALRHDPFSLYTWKSVAKMMQPHARY